MDIIQYVQTNWESILAALGAFYAFATAVAAVTPTTKDDDLLSKIGRVADRLGLKLKG